MHPEESQINHHRLVKAYLRLAEETKKIREIPGMYSIKEKPSKPNRKVKRDKEQAQNVEQLRLF